MAKTKLSTNAERFNELQFATNDDRAIKARTMGHARKIFDDALEDSSCFEEALAVVFAEGFDMGKASVKRRTRKSAVKDTTAGAE